MSSEMIKRYVFGKPMNTGAVVMDIPVAKTIDVASVEENNARFSIGGWNCSKGAIIFSFQGGCCVWPWRDPSRYQ